MKFLAHEDLAAPLSFLFAREVSTNFGEDDLVFGFQPN